MERLQKVIAGAGVTSRRKAEELITQGRVTVNGKAVTTLGTKVDPGRDIIRVDGVRVSPPRGEKKVYILLNKPRGVISAVTDPLGRPVVVDLVKKKVRERVFPVGRLDYDAEGALLLTNDGELTNRLIHPRYKIPKKYLVKVKDVPAERDLKKLERGVQLEDGVTLPAKVKFIRKTEENSWVEITVFEGRYRLVKRMFERIGHPVQKLKRTEFAGLKPGSLKPGEWRYLAGKELERLLGGMEGGRAG